MPLRGRVTLIVLLVFVLSGISSFVIQRTKVMPSFIALEKETAIQNMQRALAALQRELDQMTPTISDWAHWSDTYDYAMGKNLEYEKENLNDGGNLIELHANYMGIYNKQGQALWNRAIDRVTAQPIDIGSLSAPTLPNDHPLLHQPELLSYVKGLVETTQGPMLVIAKPILTSEQAGPAAGVLILGRFLDDALIAHIAYLTRLNINTAALVSGEPLPANRVLGKGLLHSEPHLTQNKQSWHSYANLFDLKGKAILSLQVETPRAISIQGAQAVNQSLWWLAATGSIMLIVFWTLLQRTILSPIVQLTDYATEISNNIESQAQLQLQRPDEIGQLNSAFNQMLKHLSEARSHLMEQSYRAGVSEMASGVLHNIGNTLTPINFWLAELEQNLKSVPLPELSSALNELTQQSDIKPAQRHTELQEFVQLAALEMAKLIESSQTPLTLSIKQVKQIQDILNDQHQHSRRTKVREAIKLPPLLEEARVSLAPELKRAIRVEVDPQVKTIGTVLSSRIALKQVFSNVLINAAESIQESGIKQGRVSISASLTEWRNETMLALTFRDNGNGFNPNHLDNIFERGFSTKNREGSGYGLHWCANTVLELGGKMSAHNAADNQGACIELLLPISV